MARAASTYVCQACGAIASKWSGRCDACGAWNAIVEEAAPAAGGLVAARAEPIGFVPLDAPGDSLTRQVIGIAELDRVVGGGLIPGSAVLVGGDPGIGKSTLMLQAAGSLARNGYATAYVTGEEAVEQVRLRARRLGLAEAPVHLAAATAVREIVASLDRPDAPAVVVIDSIQTMYLDSLESAPGTVAQVRATAQELIRLGKRRGITFILVGHVTKDGQIAGPRVLEHMVDTVLYFEGERSHQFRIMRAVKNRFGPVDEIGVFTMTDTGLAEVANPSALFLGRREGMVDGIAVFAGMEGTRPLLAEIQALVTGAPQGSPRRAVVGWDAGRLAMLLAVLEARCGLAFGGHDVYLNVVGGLRITEPAADLAVAAALISSLTGVGVPEKTVVFGEVGLTGEVRPVAQAAARLREAAKLGFSRAFLPAADHDRGGALELTALPRIQDLVPLLGTGAGPRRVQRRP
ncbi:MAG: DNA repair protein RadA [Alphaproteobacteria bacterium]|nr:DNA repair protein RadA [Alphaproteobacteria bacterium]